MSTIAAISTPAGVGGIAVVRISGPKAFDVTQHHIKLHQASGPSPNTSYAIFRHQGQVIDEVVVTYFKAPHSFTGEDTIEISCHGSQYAQQAILQALVDSGARLAEPGEFTRRAFLNGKLDLSQAEAVADLIHSTNTANHALAISQLRGGYSVRLNELRSQFVELASLLELELDFSEEDVEFADRAKLLSLLDTIEAECRRLCDSFSLGNAIRNGVPVAIVGRPNVGKSTLLNALVGDDRAIVSPIAGTTRDTVEDTVTINNIQFRFIDTAGIRHSDDTIEALGIQRSLQAIERAQIVLYVTDSPDTLSQELCDLQSQINTQDKQLIAILNKADQRQDTIIPHAISISAQTGLGLDTLRQQLTLKYTSDFSEQPILANVRHLEALRQVLAATTLVRQGLDNGIPADLVVVDLRDAIHHLGTITGQVSSSDILASIFSRFCIGK